MHNVIEPLAAPSWRGRFSSVSLSQSRPSLDDVYLQATGAPLWMRSCKVAGSVIQAERKTGECVDPLDPKPFPSSTGDDQCAPSMTSTVCQAWGVNLREFSLAIRAEISLWTKRLCPAIGPRPPRLWAGVMQPLIGWCCSAPCSAKARGSAAPRHSYDSASRGGVLIVFTAFSARSTPEFS